MKESNDLKIRPILLYSDGADFEKNGELHWCISGFIDSPKLAKPQYFGLRLENETLDHWLDRKKQINQVEAAAAAGQLRPDLHQGHAHPPHQRRRAHGERCEARGF